jgi:hypothetical protein
MEEGCCPNYQSCQLVHGKDFLADPEKKNRFMKQYCTGKHDGWLGCNRFIIRNSLNFCPDFVLPDSGLTPAEVLDRFDDQ